MLRPRLRAFGVLTLLLLGALGASARGRAQTPAPAPPAPVHLTTEYRVNPLGIDATAPRMAWQSQATTRDWTQQAYRILVATSPDRLEEGRTDVWDSGRQQSDRSVGVAYAGPALQSGHRYYWRVRVWDNHDVASPYSNTAWWEMGLLRAADWQGNWISRADSEARADRQGLAWIYPAGQDAWHVPLTTTATFRLTIPLDRQPAYAALHLTARGDFVAAVNGRRVTAKTRSWTAFDPTDITDALAAGTNTIEVTVTTAPPADVTPPADGRIPTAIAGLVKIVGVDGRISRYPTGPSWQSHQGTGTSWAPSAVVASVGDSRLPDPGPIAQPAGLFRHTFDVTRPVRRARLYATALGSYRMFLNGTRVGRDELTPGFTDYRKRVVYQTYDVTRLVTRGANALGAVLGAGWFGSPMSWYGNRFFFGPGPARLRAQLEIAYEDGSRDVIATDGTWTTAGAPILQDEIYGGEVYDARLERPGWSRADFDDGAWTPAAPAAGPPGVVSAQVDTPVTIAETMTPRTVRAAANGAYIFDMGQNMVGVATLHVSGPAGTRVRLRFAEILGPDGGIYRDNLRDADATDVYVLRGGGPETYTPRFTFHGFRYVEVTGYPGTPTRASVTGEVLSSLATAPTGHLSTSSPLVNQFWQVGIWGQRGNFLSVPTDCPQRDERLGWTGDAGVFWRTGSYNFDIAAFTEKWLLDLRDAQTPQGAFPDTAPHVPDLGDGAPGWGDAGVIVPWTAWMQYGDTHFIDENWDAMERWLAYIQGANPDFIRRNRVGFNFSDWLAPDYSTSKELVATAYWALIADQMSQMARATGRTEAASRYDTLHANIRNAYQRAFLHADGRIDPGTQTAYLLTLYTHLAPDAMVPAVTNHLVEAIAARDGHLSTGFLGTPFLLFALADNGHADIAYRLLLSQSYPSWGYMLSKGATTWWERWNSDTGDPAMNSYNHYAFGSVVAWVYRNVAGIDTTAAAAGFKHIVVHPRLDPRITQAHGEYDSVYGRITTDWHGTASGPFSLDVTIPANTSATVYLPAIPHAQVRESGQVVSARTEGSSYVIDVGSGTYRFSLQ